MKTSSVQPRREALPNHRVKHTSGAARQGSDQSDRSNACWRIHFCHGGTTIISCNTNNPSELKQAIRERISRASGVRVHNLEIEIDGEMVVLSGRCSTFYTKQLVQHAALDLLESRPLDNRIQVHTGDNLLTDQRPHQ